MPRTRVAYTPEFREQILALVRAGRPPNELAREFEPSGETIRQWVKQAELMGVTHKEIERLKQVFVFYETPCPFLASA